MRIDIFKQLYMDIPETFMELRPQQKEDFFLHSCNGMSYISDDASAVIAFNLFEPNRPSVDLRVRMHEYKIFYQKHQSDIDIIGIYEAKNDNLSLGLLAFFSTSSGGLLFHLILVIPIEEYEIVGCFVCTEDNSELYIPLFMKSAQTIKEYVI